MSEHSTFTQFSTVAIARAPGSVISPPEMPRPAIAEFGRMEESPNWANALSPRVARLRTLTSHP